MNRFLAGSLELKDLLRWGLLHGFLFTYQLMLEARIQLILLQLQRIGLIVAWAKAVLELFVVEMRLYGFVMLLVDQVQILILLKWSIGILLIHAVILIARTFSLILEHGIRARRIRAKGPHLFLTHHGIAVWAQAELTLLLTKLLQNFNRLVRWCASLWDQLRRAIEILVHRLEP